MGLSSYITGVTTLLITGVTYTRTVMGSTSKAINPLDSRYEVPWTFK